MADLEGVQWPHDRRQIRTLVGFWQRCQLGNELKVDPAEEVIPVAGWMPTTRPVHVRVRE
jgi:hypothetical protein